MPNNMKSFLAYGYVFLAMILFSAVALASPPFAAALLLFVPVMFFLSTSHNILRNAWGAVGEYMDEGKIFKRPLVKQVIVEDLVINLNAASPPIKEPWPLGEGWYKIKLVFKNAVVIGTGTGAIANGLARIIKNIQLKTSADGVLIDASGVSLQRRLQKLIKTAPFMTTLAAANGTYNFALDLMFYNPALRRPEDSVLNSARYKSVELKITYGGLADLFSSVGTATLATTLDVYLYKSEFNVTPSNAPKFLPYFADLPTKLFQNADSYIELEKDEELLVTSLLVGMTDNTGTAGISWSGAEAAVNGSKWTIEDNSHPFLFDRISMVAMLSDAKHDNELESPGAGTMLFNMIDDRSVFSSYSTGDKSKFRLKWDRNGDASTYLITAVVDGLKYLDQPTHGVMIVKE